MFKQFISSIPGADVYMIFSLLTFLLFFLLVGVYLVLMDRGYRETMENLPLNDQIQNKNH